MSLFATLQVALRALTVNRLRSSLTMLGIIIGVAAVITMIAVGRGAQARVEEQITSLGSNLIIVIAGSAFTGGVRQGGGSGLSLSEEDAAAIEVELPHVLTAPGLRGNAQIVAGNQNWSSPVWGITPPIMRHASGT
jgi:putative ABC transport system permease protein